MDIHLLIKIFLIYFQEIIFLKLQILWDVFYDTIIVESVQPCGIGSFSSVPPVCYGDANGKIIVNSVFGSSPFYIST